MSGSEDEDKETKKKIEVCRQIRDYICRDSSIDLRPLSACAIDDWSEQKKNNRKSRSRETRPRQGLLWRIHGRREDAVTVSSWCSSSGTSHGLQSHQIDSDSNRKEVRRSQTLFRSNRVSGAEEKERSSDHTCKGVKWRELKQTKKFAYALEPR